MKSLFSNLIVLFLSLLSMHTLAGERQRGSLCTGTHIESTCVAAG